MIGGMGSQTRLGDIWLEQVPIRRPPLRPFNTRQQEPDSWSMELTWAYPMRVPVRVIGLVAAPVPQTCRSGAQVNTD